MTDPNLVALRTPTLSTAGLAAAIADARSNGRFGDAEVFCRAAIGLEPDNASLRVLLGWIALNQKNYLKVAEAVAQATCLPGANAIEIARLSVYSAAASGDWSSAKATLLDLSGENESAAHLIAAETAPSFLTKINDLKQAGAYREAVNSFQSVPELIEIAAPAVMREISAAASVCYLAMGRPEEAIDVFKHVFAPSSLTPYGSSESGGSRPVLVTSLMPARLDVQKTAVASWQRQGFDVASVNAGDEIRLLQGEFDGVTFHAAARDARERLGRPLVYVDDMLAVLAGQRTRIGGLINSDIVFSDDASEVLLTGLSSANDALLFGHRLDVASLDEPGEATSKLLLFGYDWFLFRTDRASHLIGGEMVFGAPWWDLWLPVKARSSGLDIVNVRQPIAMHENHPIRWDPRDMEAMARSLANTLAADSKGMPPFSRFQHRVAKLAQVLASVDPMAFEERRFLDWMASLIRGLIQLEATPLEVESLGRVKPFWDSMGQI